MLEFQALIVCRKALTCKFCVALFSHLLELCVFFIPKGLLDDIDRICRQFLWGGGKPAMVNWETMCQPKKYGGLGLKNIY